MKTLFQYAFFALVAVGLVMSAGPSQAQDCDAMVGEVDQLLQTATLTQEEKDQVMQLRDEGMDQNSRAGGDCTTALSQALDILKSK